MKLMRLDALGYALIIIYFWPSMVAAAIVNATIDDQDGHVLYYPSTPNVWRNQTCDGTKCTVVPNKLQAFNNTYTAATYSVGLGSMGISMQFTGTAIYVFFILGALTPPYPPTLNSANFTLDHNMPVLFKNHSTDIQYNVAVFSQTNLSNTLHTLNITASGPTEPIYVNFDYAIYTYDDSVSTTTSPLPSVSTVTIVSQAPSTTVTGAPSPTVTGAPAPRTPVGAIVGGIACGITLLALVIFLLFCWHRRRGHGTLQSARQKGSSEPLVTQFNGGGDSLASGMLFGSESSNTDSQANMRNNYQPLHSGEIVLSLGSQHLPSSEKVLPSSTSNSSVLGTSSDNLSTSPLLPSPLNVTGTREEVRRARQKNLNDRLRVVQNNIVQLEASNAGQARSVLLRWQNSEEAEIIEEEMHMSVADMQEAIRSQREQIRVLREQQQSAWALGLSDDPPPGYTPMEVGMQISREASS